MFKVSLLVACCLAVACVVAQEAANEAQNAAPEPYAYAYQTDSSSAAEQRSPDGKVTGYYTLTDPADGRERRVEYVADENGFRAKVATNELGTKSENSADVEVLASPPSEAQLVYQAPQQQVQRQQQFVAYQQAPQQQQQRFVSTTVAQAPAVRQTYGYVQQQQQPIVYGANSGYNYGYYPVAGYGYQSGVYGNNQNAAYGVYGTTGNYNYHTPGSYYSRFSSVQQPAAYATYGGAQNVRYVASSQTVPVGGATYTTYSNAPVLATSTRTVSSSSSSSGSRAAPANLGSGNLLLLKK